jgi:hypothetical protein
MQAGEGRTLASNAKRSKPDPRRDHPRRHGKLRRNDRTKGHVGLLPESMMHNAAIATDQLPSPTRRVRKTWSGLSIERQAHTEYGSPGQQKAKVSIRQRSLWLEARTNNTV